MLMPQRMPRCPLWTALRRDSRIRIVFEVHDVSDLPRRTRSSLRTPDVVVADMDIGVGVRTVLRTVKTRLPGVPVVMVDRTSDSARAQRARNLGVAAVLTRRTPPERFIARLFDVVRENTWAPERFDAQLVEPLTPREWDILPYIARRYSAKEIAEELTISYATVRTHLRNIYAKCGVGSRRHAALVAETLLRERYAVGDNTHKEVSRDDELRRRDGRPDPQSERRQVYARSSGDRGGQPVVRQ